MRFNSDFSIKVFDKTYRSYYNLSCFKLNSLTSLFRRSLVI